MTDTDASHDDAAAAEVPLPGDATDAEPSDTATGPDQIRLAFWNTFLLHPRPLPGGPALPEFGELAAPAVSERAVAIGRALAGRFDVVAMAEAFEPADRALLVDAWGATDLVTATGPARSIVHGPLGFTSSGLFTVVDGPRVVRERTHQFEERGSYRYDADTLANKGVLLVEIDLAGHAANLEVYSTHLSWGTGLLGGPQAEDPVRRHGVRMAQVDELVAFIGRTHRPGNVALLVGDMNVPAIDLDFPGGPTAQYDDLVGRLGTLGLDDLWPASGTGAGDTCGAPTDEFADQRDPDDADALVDPVEVDTTRVPRADLDERVRIDYAFLQRPASGDRVRVRATAMRRYAFPRAADAPKRDRLVRLSDHLAIGVDLEISDV